MLVTKIKSVLFGVAVGDALGVPVEFRSRESLQSKPITAMVGYGTHHQPAGTFSDDSSMMFCLAEALANDFSLQALASNFISWFRDGYWTPHGDVFDFGMTTAEAIQQLQCGTAPEKAGGTSSYSNGNGSLMRIAPLVFYLLPLPASERFRWTQQVSSVTHGHIRSVIACYYYLEFARLLLEGRTPTEAYSQLQQSLPAFFQQLDIDQEEVRLFSRLLEGDIAAVPEKEIESSGYVLHTLEAAIWCLRTTDSYAAAVLKAVNLGGDTDTTGAVAGGLAGLYYGLDAIPADWRTQLARHADIEQLASRLAAALTTS